MSDIGPINNNNNNNNNNNDNPEYNNTTNKDNTKSNITNNRDSEKSNESSHGVSDVTKNSTRGRKKRGSSAHRSLSNTIVIEDRSTLSAQSIRDQIFKSWLETKKYTPDATLPTTEIVQSNRDIVDSAAMRDSNFRYWLAGKEFNRRHKQQLDQLALKATQSDLEKEACHRRETSEIVYKHWKANKKPLLNNKLIQKSIEAVKEREKLEKLENRKLEAENYFSVWANKKKIELDEKSKQKRLEKSENILELEERREVRAEESQNIYRSWRNKKTTEMLNNHKEKIEKEKLVQDNLKNAKITKQTKAIEAYHIWFDKKDKEMQNNHHLTRSNSSQLLATPNKWRPPGTPVQDYPKSVDTLNIEHILDLRKNQLRTTTAKHSATA